MFFGDAIGNLVEGTVGIAEKMTDVTLDGIGAGMDTIGLSVSSSVV